MLGVASVNHQLITTDVRLVANPNCTTIPLMLTLGALRARFGLRDATVSTYQAISGAGLAAVDQFIADSRARFGEIDRLGSGFAVSAYTANTVPHAGGTDDSGFSSEERKLMFESRKILALPDFPISAQCCRVPVLVGHYENVWLTLERAAVLSEVAAVLNETRFVRFFADPAGNELTALATVHDRDRALVGRLRRDERDASGRSLCLTVAGDNLRLGAATNAVRLATAWFPTAERDLSV